MNNEILIKDSGLVTGDALLSPVAYAGEMNSRVLNIVHPTFSDAIYQLLIIKNDYPYVLGVVDGKVILPPSLTSTAVTLQCQFIATRKNENLAISETCDCQISSSDDCSQMVFKSDKFLLKVDEGLILGGLTPIPPYEQLLDIYNNISKAKLAVEKVKAENQELLLTIEEKINQLQQMNVMANTVLNDENKIMITDVITSLNKLKNENNINRYED